jgi:cation diffusion facilitator family transporter
MATDGDQAAGSILSPWPQGLLTSGLCSLMFCPQNNPLAIPGQTVRRRVLAMHSKHMDRWIHDHQYNSDASHAEHRTQWVIALTGLTMVAEIVAGWLTGSMALLADGWHMGTHMFALGITVFAYRYARRHRGNPAFTFGTGKVQSLAGFASSIVLGIVALGMAGESVHRLFNQREIHVGQAFIVASIGLVVNLLSVAMLHPPHAGHDHDHEHDHGHSHHHDDHNLRAAFLHVVADALTSLLAMGALLGVRYWNMPWLDPLVGILGAILILVWAFGLLRDTSRVLLDAGVAPETVEQVRTVVEADADNRVVDLHVWSLGGNALSVAITVVTHRPRAPEHYRQLLEPIAMIRHSTIEVVACEGEPCIPTDVPPPQRPDR